MKFVQLTKNKFNIKEQNQPTTAGILIFLVLIIAVCIFSFLPVTMFYSWIFGLLVGFVLQRSRICFTAALREPFLFGMTALTRALILSLMITTLGFALFQYFQVISGAALPGKIIPPGWNITIGGFIFGIGAAISGGCASGSLVRTGEGFQMQWVALLGFVFGSVHGAYDAGFWYQLFKENTLSHLPSLLGWWEALLLQMLFLGLLYYLARNRENKKFSL